MIIELSSSDVPAFIQALDLVQEVRQLFDMPVDDLSILLRGRRGSFP